MDFFNKLGQKANEVYQATKEKASDVSGEIKIKAKITALNDKNNLLYTEIGKELYEEIKSGNGVNTDKVAEKIDSVTKNLEEIARLKSDLLDIKGIKKCVQCGEEMDIASEFCSKCGAKQPTVEVKEGIVEENSENQNNDENKEE